MRYILYPIAVVLAYVIQTALFTNWLFKPELFLILLCLFWSGRRYSALWLGLATGLFLDIFNGYSFYNTALYAMVGYMCGFMPVSIFRDARTLALVNLLLGSLFLNIGYPVFVKIFSGKFVFVHPLHYALVVLLNVIFFYALYWIFWRGKND